MDLSALITKARLDLGHYYGSDTDEAKYLLQVINGSNEDKIKEVIQKLVDIGWSTTQLYGEDATLGMNEFYGTILKGNFVIESKGSQPRKRDRMETDDPLAPPHFLPPPDDASIVNPDAFKDISFISLSKENETKISIQELSSLFVKNLSVIPASVIDPGPSAYIFVFPSQSLMLGWFDDIREFKSSGVEITVNPYLTALTYLMGNKRIKGLPNVHYLAYKEKIDSDGPMTRDTRLKHLIAYATYAILSTKQIQGAETLKRYFTSRLASFMRDPVPHDEMNKGTFKLYQECRSVFTSHASKPFREAIYQSTKSPGMVDWVIKFLSMIKTMVSNTGNSTFLQMKALAQEDYILRHSKFSKEARSFNQALEKEGLDDDKWLHFLHPEKAGNYSGSVYPSLATLAAMRIKENIPEDQKDNYVYTPRDISVTEHYAKKVFEEMSRPRKKRMRYQDEEDDE